MKSLRGISKSDSCKMSVGLRWTYKESFPKIFKDNTPDTLKSISNKIQSFSESHQVLIRGTLSKTMISPYTKIKINFDGRKNFMPGYLYALCNKSVHTKRILQYSDMLRK